jgi:hypothetical protein
MPPGRAKTEAISALADHSGLDASREHSADNRRICGWERPIFDRARLAGHLDDERLVVGATVSQPDEHPLNVPAAPPTLGRIVAAATSSARSHRPGEA